MSESAGEQACVYAALILHDDGVEITAEKLSTLVKAANVEAESIWFSLFAKALASKNLDDLLMNVGSGAAAPASGAAAPAAAGGAAAPAAEEKPQEKEESDEDMGFGLFD